MILPQDLMVSDDGTVTVNTAPGTPSSLTVPAQINGGSTVTVEWGASTDAENNLEGYELERSLDGGSTWANVYRGGARSTTNTVPFGSDTVMYRVRAYDDAGLASAWRTGSQVTVINNTAPSVPDGISVPQQVQGGQPLTVTWGASTDDQGNLAGYSLERQVDGGAWEVVYLVHELQARFERLWGKLCTTASVREASDAVLLDFERPACVNDPDKLQAAKDRRGKLAQEFYDKFVGGKTMSYLMTSKEFCDRVEDIADHYATAYMLGPWGWPATDKMIIRATTQGSNAKTNKQWLSKANTIKGRGFLFDCVGLIKGVLWGWSGDLSRPYGGAGYACNGVPDYDAKKMIDCCREVSTDFTRIVPGEAVWMDGHIGVYVGSGMVVESTPKWQGGVQWSICLNAPCDNICCGAGARTWTKHGKLPWVDYSAAEKNDEEDDEMTEEQVRRIVRDEYARMEKEWAALPVSPWAKKSVEGQVEAGVTDGTRPQSYATRQELFVALDRFFGAGE